MFIRGYLRASTDDQDATRARETLRTFAAGHGVRVAAFYVENASGTILERPQLLRLLADSEPGDILLVEAVDRLSRLKREDWELLRERIALAGLNVVAIDLPLTHSLLNHGGGDQTIQAWMERALSQMFLEFMAAFARKDYETRRERQAQGIGKAKKAGLYRGRRPDLELQRKIYQCLDGEMSVRKTADLLGCSTSTVSRCKRAREQARVEAQRAEAAYLERERRAQLGLPLADV